MILLLVLIGAGVYLIFTGSRRPGRAERDRALTIAGERYARGEISREEFAEIKKTISET